MPITVLVALDTLALIAAICSEITGNITDKTIIDSNKIPI